MARGFESKDVEYQQSEASRPQHMRRELTPEERETQSKRRSLELALARARAERDAATSRAYQQTLDQAIQALETRLRSGE